MELFGKSEGKLGANNDATASVNDIFKRLSHLEGSSSLIIQEIEKREVGLETTHSHIIDEINRLRERTENISRTMSVLQSNITQAIQNIKHLAHNNDFEDLKLDVELISSDNLITFNNLKMMVEEAKKQ